MSIRGMILETEHQTKKKRRVHIIYCCRNIPLYDLTVTGSPTPAFVYLTDADASAVPGAGASAIPKLALKSFVNVGKTSQAPAAAAAAPHGAAS